MREVCPEFICPSCGNEDTQIMIERVSHSTMFPGFQEPEDNEFDEHERVYSFNCDECGFYADSYNLSTLMEDMDMAYTQISSHKHID